MRPRLTIKENYAFLLAGLLFLFLLIPTLRMFPKLAADYRFMSIAVEVGFCLMMLIGVWGLHRQRRLFRLGLWLAALSTFFFVADIFIGSGWLEKGASLLTLTFCVFSGYIAARHVFSGGEINRNMLYGAVCVYLLIGLIWAILYGMIFEFFPSAFQGMGVFEGKAPFDNLLYYSFVTLASLGYGDITPIAPLARTLAYLEVIVGQFYIAIMVAGLVGLYMKDSSLR